MEMDEIKKRCEESIHRANEEYEDRQVANIDEIDRLSSELQTEIETWLDNNLELVREHIKCIVPLKTDKVTQGVINSLMRLQESSKGVRQAETATHQQAVVFQRAIQYGGDNLHQTDRASPGCQSENPEGPGIANDQKGVQALDHTFAATWTFHFDRRKLVPLFQEDPVQRPVSFFFFFFFSSFFLFFSFSFSFLSCV